LVSSVGGSLLAPILLPLTICGGREGGRENRNKKGRGMKEGGEGRTKGRELKESTC